MGGSWHAFVFAGSLTLQGLLWLRDRLHSIFPGWSALASTTTLAEL
jgi:hypothetical protein